MKKVKTKKTVVKKYLAQTVLIERMEFAFETAKDRRGFIKDVKKEYGSDVINIFTSEKKVRSK